VSRLIDHGADATVATYEGRNILHVAARARQTNTIGLLLEHFSTIDRVDLINAPDSRGRTPLHDACRSGRPESVALLLQSGANPNARDKDGNTPLHTCSEFKEEQILWDGIEKKHAKTSVEIEKDVHARGVLMSDEARPQPSNTFQQRPSKPWGGILNETDTARITDIIVLLLTQGADINVNNKNCMSVLDVAIEKCCEEATRIFSRFSDERASQPSEVSGSFNRLFAEGYLNLRSKNLRVLLLSQIHPGETNLDLCGKLLKLREFDAIRMLPDLGVRFGPYRKKMETDFLTTLATHGYADLLSYLGAKVEEPDWVNGKQLPPIETGLPQDEKVRPYIKSAVTSHLPNLEVLKVLVEQFQANVNIQEVVLIRENGSPIYVPGGSPLHILAESKYWWQAEGLEYLLNHGGDPEIQDENGQTVLHIAVSKIRNNAVSVYRRHETTHILLAHGANPNAIDNQGVSCLSKAAHDPELVYTLIKAGASVNETALSFAITTCSVEVVQAMLRTGVNPNALVQESIASLRTTNRQNQPEWCLYPLGYAASSKFHTVMGKPAAIRIVELLLENGANPWISLTEEQTTIIHGIFASGGILEPFLDNSNLDLECRDEKGRTLLLAACSSPGGIWLAETSHAVHMGQSFPMTRRAIITNNEAAISTPAFKLYEKGASLTAVSNNGNNSLHYLIQSYHYPNSEVDYQKTFKIFVEQAPSLMEMKNEDKETPFLLAIKKRKLWEARLLLDKGSDPKVTDAYGNNALHSYPLAASLRGEWISFFKELLNLGTDVNAANTFGETPAFAFFSSTFTDHDRIYLWHNEGISHEALVTPLLDAGADLLVHNNEGEGLLHVVAKSKNCDRVQMFQLLMGLGLDPMVEDQRSRTPLDVASACGNSDIMDLFKRDRVRAKE
jgi:ankyrin repeat protein